MALKRRCRTLYASVKDCSDTEHYTHHGEFSEPSAIDQLNQPVRELVVADVDQLMESGVGKAVRSIMKCHSCDSDQPWRNHRYVVKDCVSVHKSTSLWAGLQVLQAVLSITDGPLPLIRFWNSSEGALGCTKTTPSKYVVKS
jgi:hypothetical protein